MKIYILKIYHVNRYYRKKSHIKKKLYYLAELLAYHIFFSHYLINIICVIENKIVHTSLIDVCNYLKRSF